jgi:hypothetical protein
MRLAFGTDTRFAVIACPGHVTENERDVEQDARKTVSVRFA